MLFMVSELQQYLFQRRDPLLQFLAHGLSWVTIVQQEKRTDQCGMHKVHHQCTGPTPPLILLALLVRALIFG